MQIARDGNVVAVDIAKSMVMPKKETGKRQMHAWRDSIAFVPCVSMGRRCR